VERARARPIAAGGMLFQSINACTMHNAQVSHSQHDDLKNLVPACSTHLCVPISNASGDATSD
jgi:hypothetical protein